MPKVSLLLRYTSLYASLDVYRCIPPYVCLPGCVQVYTSPYMPPWVYIQGYLLHICLPGCIYRGNTSHICLPGCIYRVYYPHASHVPQGVVYPCICLPCTLEWGIPCICLPTYPRVWYTQYMPPPLLLHCWARRGFPAP